MGANGRCLIDMSARFLHRAVRSHREGGAIFSSLTKVVADVNEHVTAEDHHGSAAERLIRG